MIGNTEDAVLRDLELMSPARNYSRWIHEELAGFLGQRIVECGAGIGNNTRLLLDRELVVATDAHEPCVDFLATRFSEWTNVTALRAALGEPDFRSLARYEPDTIVCVNVLEHVEDDLSALQDMRDVLSGFGRVILLVPAHPVLFGSMDRRLGHFRRYTRRALLHQLARAGLSVEHSFYMNTLGTLGWFVNNRIFHISDQSPGQISVFDRLVVPWLRRAERAVRPPFGMSLVAVGRPQASGC